MHASTHAFDTKEGVCGEHLQIPLLNTCFWVTLLIVAISAFCGVKKHERVLLYVPLSKVILQRSGGEVNFRFLCFPLLLTPILVRTLHDIQSIPR